MNSSDNINNSESNSNYSTIASPYEKRLYKDMQKNREIISEKYNKFFENFELTKYISSGGTGIVYEGYLKRARKK